MTTRAYDKFFLPGMMKNLGFAVDFAVNGCGLTCDSFYNFFIASKVAREIENGSPIFVGGCSGTELALLERAGKVFERGDFYLSQAEQKLVEQVKSAFDKVVIVLNAGGTLSASWFSQDDRISSVLMAWQAGMEGGLAEADIL